MIYKGLRSVYTTKNGRYPVLGECLKVIRWAADMDQKAMANYLGCSEIQVQQMEMGKVVKRHLKKYYNLIKSIEKSDGYDWQRFAWWFLVFEVMAFYDDSKFCIYSGFLTVIVDDLNREIKPGVWL